MTHDAGRHRSGRRTLASTQHGYVDLDGQQMTVSYSHEDKAHLRRFRIALAGLEHQGLVILDDHEVEAGAEWQDVILEWFRKSNSIVFLVSPNLLASTYVWDEMNLALELHDQQLTQVIPVIVRPADWKRSPLGAFQALPSGGRAVSTWSNRDEAWQDVTEGIYKAVA